MRKGLLHVAATSEEAHQLAAVEVETVFAWVSKSTAVSRRVAWNGSPWIRAAAAVKGLTTDIELEVEMPWRKGLLLYYEAPNATLFGPQKLAFVADD